MKVKRETDSKIEQGGGGSRYHSASRSVAEAPPASFGHSLEELEVQALLERLNVIAAKLSVFPAERLLMEYRVVLKELLARAMSGFRMKRDLKWRRNDRAMFVTVERAEAALAELEEALLHEGGRSRALQLMEEIKGCLISLLF